MSGFEVAGVILGVIPIIITALQQYQTANKKLSYFRHKVLYVDRLIDCLVEQKTLIDNDLCILLRATGVDIGSTEDFNTLVDYGQIFQNNDVEQELRDFLGATFDPYRNALVRCEEALKRITVKLGGFTTGKLVWYIISDTRDV